MAAVHVVGRAHKQVLLPGVVVRAFNRELQVFARIGNRAQQVHGEQRHHAEVGAVRRAGQAGRVAHVRDLHGACHPAHVADVGLDDVDHLRVNHVLPQRQQAVLLAAGHVQRQRLAHFAGLVHFPVQAGLFKVADAVVLQHAAHLNRALRRETAVGVH